MSEPRVVHEHLRGCGLRQEGGLYLVGEMSPEGALPPIVLIEPPIPFQGEHFRGFVYVDGDQLVAREPQETWYIGPSLDRTIRQQWLTELGMPLSVRRAIGLGLGIQNQAELAQRLSQLHAPVPEEGFRRDIEVVRAHLDKNGAMFSQACAATNDLLRSHMAPRSLAYCWIIARATLWDDFSCPDCLNLRNALARIMVRIGARQDAADLMSGRWLKVWRKHAKD